MARKPVLRVYLSRKAIRQLNEIYEYNIEKRGSDVADRYIGFLRSQIAGLAAEYDEGRPIESRPDLRYILMKVPGKWKDGHVAVYEVVQATQTVEVRLIFHTKQDWESQL